MPRVASAHADDYERWFRVKGELKRFTGYVWFGNAAKSKKAAAAVRHEFKIPCRSVKVPGSWGGFVDRWGMFLPFTSMPWDTKHWPEGLREFIAGLEGYDTVD